MLVVLFFSTCVSSLRSSSSTVSTCRRARHLHHHQWTHISVEWSPHVATVYDSLESSVAPTHFVFPDLPHVSMYDEQHRTLFHQSTRPDQRMPTLAVGPHGTSSWQSLVATAKTRLGILTDRTSSSLLSSFPSSFSSSSLTTDEVIGLSPPPPPHHHHHATKLLIVGGNDKGNHQHTLMTTEQAVTILRSELDDDLLLPTTPPIELWAVADPNDPDSPRRVETKVQAGIQGIITQPLLTSTAWETLDSYKTRTTTTTTKLVVGMACPRTVHHLHFWRTLLNRPEWVADDPLFQSHLDYFSQQLEGKSTSSLSLTWMEHELQQLSRMKAKVDGLHFMPLRNVEDLVTLFGSLRLSQNQ